MTESYKEVVVMLVGGIIIFLILAGILIFVLLFYQKKKFQHVSQLLQSDKLHTEMLLQSKIEIQEETFRNISQEIHDNIGQTLSLVKLNLNAISAPENQHDKERLTESISLLAGSIKDLRDVARSINTDYIAQIGLSKAIQQQLNVLQKTGMFTTSLEETGVSGTLEKRDELILFRVVQELLNNIVKHAEATQIRVRIFYETDELRLTVEDNGIGFDTTKVVPSKDIPDGLGLSNLHHRITFIKGQLIIDSIPGRGTMISVEVPWPSQTISR
jgi:two-component system, NarL family, sensor kinase